MPPRLFTRRLLALVLLCGSLFGLATGASAASIPVAKRQVCAYTQNQTQLLTAFAALAGRANVDCDMVYVGSSNWSGWDNPWFLHYPDPNYNWAGWVRTSPANDPRQLIVNIPLIPSNLSTQDWRAQGAAGSFAGYDRTLAQNLVSGGVSNAIIVLGAEANGNWEYDNIGSNPNQIANWVQTWRNAVLAMRSVPGANFQFVWAVNNRIPATPFASYYPGDDVVDIIGDDAYDSAVTADANDWNEVANNADGVTALVAFAQSHNKPIAFPEWGVGVRNQSNLAGNDDPGYVNGLASVVAAANVAFQCYFYNNEWETELQQGAASLAAYRAAYGDGGWAVGGDDGENLTPTPTFTQLAPPAQAASAPAPTLSAAPAPGVAAASGSGSGAASSASTTTGPAPASTAAKATTSTATATMSNATPPHRTHRRGRTRRVRRRVARMPARRAGARRADSRVRARTRARR